MAKLSNSKKSGGAEKLGKGNITPVQVAFIVDRYLCDNNYTHTRSTFRSEASGLISGSPVQEVPKSLLSLRDMLDEYISLKEQKVLLEQERYHMEQDKLRVQNLLKGFQNAMTAFNASAHLASAPLTSPNFAPIMSSSGPIVAVPDPPIGSPAAGCSSALDTPMVLSTSKPNGCTANSSSISIPAVNHSSKKRKGFNDGSDALTSKRHHKSSVSKKSHLKGANSRAHSNGQPPWKALAFESLPNSNASSRSRVEGQGVVKCLFNQPAQSLPNASSGPKTPPLASSSQNEKSDSPLELQSYEPSSKDVNQELTTTNCTITSTETIQVSPNKQISYSITRNHQISTYSPMKPNSKRSNTRDHVKGRLNFDVTDDQCNIEASTSERTLSPESFEETDILDLDLTSLEALGNINLTELLIDFDIDGLETCQPHAYTTPDSTLCYQATSGVDTENDGFVSQISSTVTEIRSDKDMTSSGIDAVTTRKSVTKCIKMISPAKNRKTDLDEQLSICG